MKKIALLSFSILAFEAIAQGSSQSQNTWKFPTNIQGICKNIEQSLVQTYKLELENNQIFANEQLPENQRREANFIADGARKRQRLDEERWYKLGCINFQKN